MRYPVSNTGSKEEFERDWKIDQIFGNQTTYGFHEGVDINLKTGGDTDLGQELKSISNGKIVYYHYASHPSTAFGRHLVIRIDGAWGSRWVHYCHCLETGFLNSSQDVSEGQIVAHLGKSGTTAAHLHFSIFKVDPASIGGIDQIARNTTDLNNWWEDPIAFMEKWMQIIIVPQPVITDQTKIPQIDNMEVQAIRSFINDQKTRITNQENKIIGLEDKISQIRTIIQ
jgi:hypothetical protein